MYCRLSLSLDGCGWASRNSFHCFITNDLIEFLALWVASDKRELIKKKSDY